MNRQKLEEEVDNLITRMLGAFTRRVVNEWIVPSKSRSYYEDLRRVFHKDESSEGLYPACVVTQDLLGEVVVIMPLDKFTALLELWKKEHPKWVKNATKLVEKEEKQKC